MGKINPTAKLLKLIFDTTNYKHLIDSSMFITGSTGFLGSAILRFFYYLEKIATMLLYKTLTILK